MGKDPLTPSLCLASGPVWGLLTRVKAVNRQLGQHSGKSRVWGSLQLARGHATSTPWIKWEVG